MPKIEDATITEVAVNSEVQPVDPAPAADVVAVDSDKDWSSVLIVVGNHRFPKDGRPVIVCQSQVPQFDDNKILTGFETKLDGYPAGADIYFRMDDIVDFPAGEVVTLGGENQPGQGMFWGFSPVPQYLHTGPSYPSYAAANLAWLRGAKKIEIVGLSDLEKERLRPYLDLLASGGPSPVAGAPDVRSPADVEITLT